MKLRKKMFKIQIHSNNVLNNIPALSTGTTPDWRDGFYCIDLPSVIDGDKYQFAVETFAVNYTTVSSGYCVHCDIVQPDTYSTATKSTNDIICTNAYSNVYFKPIDFNTMGTPLKQSLRSRTVRIYLTALDNTLFPTATIFGSALVWTMTIAVYPIDFDD